MQDITDTSSCVTSNLAREHAQHTVISTLRPVGIPIEPLRVTPKSVPRHRTLTATPADWPTGADVDRAIGAYGPLGAA